MSGAGLIDRALLAAWLVTRDSDDCLLYLGVGRLTAERIAAGEVEPSADILIRIRRAIGAPHPSLDRGATHGRGPLAGGVPSEGAAGLFSDSRP